jgi:ribulose-phosphate 3-epimerase
MFTRAVPNFVFKVYMSRTAIERIRRSAPAILPSLLMCDFGDLKGEVARLEAAGSTVLHLDVMDGHFVPNLTYGMPIVEGLRKHTDLPLDVHLMISNPLKYAKAFVDAGADLLTFHVEAVADPVSVAQAIADLDVGVGIAINPSTPTTQFDACLKHVDLALVMSVDAGFGGQAFNPIALDRLKSIRQKHPDLLLEIDGGINAETIGSARAAGCDLFVVGSALFKHNDYGKAISNLMTAMESQLQ